MIYFAFKGNISEQFAKKLNLSPLYLLVSSKTSIEKFVDELILLNPDRILGIGSYSGRDQDKICIELLCKNKFRNDIIGKEKSYLLDNFVEINEYFKESKGGMGNSYCNLISYLIMTAKNEGKLKSKYSFLHIPKNFFKNSKGTELTILDMCS